MLKDLGLVTIDLRTPEDIEEEQQAQDMTIPAAAVPLIADLIAMPENDPKRGTEHEGAFLDTKTRPRTIEIGKALHDIGGHTLMRRAHNEVSAKGGFSYRSLEMAWDESW